MDNQHLPVIGPEPLTLTVSQTAKRLQIGKNQVYELIHAGDLPAIRLGNRFLVVAELLEEWLKQKVKLQQLEHGQPSSMAWL